MRPGTRLRDERVALIEREAQPLRGLEAGRKLDPEAVRVLRPR